MSQRDWRFDRHRRQGDRLNTRSWIERLKRLSRRHADHVELDSIIASLVELHEAMLAAPSSVFQRYNQISEDVLDEGGRRADRIIEGDFCWRAQEEEDPESWLTELGCQIRGLDEALADFAPHNGVPFGRDPGEDWLAPDGSWFVIPRALPLEPTLASRRNKSYWRRGLLRNRILPTAVGGLPVKLHFDSSTDAKATPGPLGAALFENLTLTLTKTADGFVATELACNDPMGTIVRQLEGALDDGCDCLVWPELTIPPLQLSEIIRILGQRPIDDRRPAPRIVLAGSWHVAGGGGTMNVAPVLDGYGKRLLSVAKNIPFTSGRTGPEAIVSGNRLPVLVTDDRLVAFAVCRDFCDRDVDPPYVDLDVDLLIVPSMGQANTMGEHLNVAKTARVRYRCGTFVVQQLDEPAVPAGKEPIVRPHLGFVLPAPDDPTARPVADLAQAETYRSYRR